MFGRPANLQVKGVEKQDFPLSLVVTQLDLFEFSIDDSSAGEIWSRFANLRETGRSHFILAWIGRRFLGIWNLKGIKTLLKRLKWPWNEKNSKKKQIFAKPINNEKSMWSDKRRPGFLNRRRFDHHLGHQPQKERGQKSNELKVTTWYQEKRIDQSARKMTAKQANQTEKMVVADQSELTEKTKKVTARSVFGS